ncbi:MAG: hypothetical protein AAFU79_25980 [Myxococcota bacterium]
MPSPAFPSSTYSETEVSALRSFASSWSSFCDLTPAWPETYEELFLHPAWSDFREAAAEALSKMLLRGKLQEVR